MLMMTGPLRFGPLEPDEIRCHLAAIAQQDSVMARFTVCSGEATLASRAGRTDEALDFVRQSSSLAGELALTLLHITGRWNEAAVLFAGGRVDDAIACCRWVVDELERSGHTSFRSTALLDLAAMHYARGEADEAERLAAEGESTSAAEDVINFAYGDALRARIASDRGPTDEAEPLARRALEYAYRTDFPSVQAKAHEALGHVLAGAGRQEQADEERRRALELWDRYGFVVEAGRLRSLLGVS
jgi:tetratricopeptide (TPR) repeat protein